MADEKGKGLRQIYEMSDGEWAEMLSVNLTGTFNVIRAAVPVMKDQGFGRIVNVSSTAGQRGEALHSHYAASKGGLDNLVRHLAVEWARHGINVNAIAPSYFPTEMTVDPELGDVAEDQKARMRQFTPLDRLGRPGEIETAGWGDCICCSPQPGHHLRWRSAGVFDRWPGYLHEAELFDLYVAASLYFQRPQNLLQIQFSNGPRTGTTRLLCRRADIE